MANAATDPAEAGRRLFQLRALHVFRDQTNLAASPALWSSIESALAVSRYMLLLASPSSAASPTSRQALLHDVGAVLLGERAVMDTELRALGDCAAAGLPVPQPSRAARELGHRTMIAAGLDRRVGRLEGERFFRRDVQDREPAPRVRKIQAASYFVDASAEQVAAV